ncbi:MAG: hypothetical protein WBM62_07165, partial [Crocosphaera sp.]
MFSKSIRPLLHSYQTLCLQCPLIERANILDYLVQKFNIPLFSWNPATQKICLLKDTSVENPDQNVSLLTPIKSEQTQLNFSDLKSVLFTWQQRQESGILIIENGLSLIKESGLDILLTEVLNACQEVDKFLIFLEMDEHGVPDSLVSVIPSLSLPIPTVNNLEQLAEKLNLSTDLLLPGLGLYSEEICQGVRLAQGSNTAIDETLLNYKIERFQALGLALNPTPKAIDVGG